MQGYFFFSSRSRHTRSLRDWSSDVCSSDLGSAPALRRPAGGGAAAGAADRAAAGLRPPPGRRARSEERRVGKSVDPGGSPTLNNKKPIQSDPVNDAGREICVVLPTHHGCTI